MAPIAIGVVRNRKYTPKPNLQHEAYCKAKTNSDAAGVIAHSTPHLYPPRESIFSVWVSNSTTTVRHMTVEIRYISISTGLEKQNTTSIKIDVKVVGTTEVFDAETPDDADTVLAVRLFDENETLVSRESDWPQPLKHIRFPERSLKVRIERGECVISTDKPVKGLVLLNDDVVWSDNCLDIMPGDEQRLSVDGLVGDVRFVHYGIDD
jgi:beta-mannosidase